MMSEEEKKALKDCDIIFMCLEDMMSEESANDNRKSYKIIRNLIEKQQKEIEELKDTRSIFNMGRRSYKNEIEYKIKAKIEELENEIEEKK